MSSLKGRKELENEWRQALKWMVQALSVCWGGQWARFRDVGPAALSSRYWAVSLLAGTKGKLQQEKQLAALIAPLSTPASEQHGGEGGFSLFHSPPLQSSARDFVVPLGVLCVLLGTIVSLCVPLPAGAFS